MLHNKNTIPYKLLSSKPSINWLRFSKRFNTEVSCQISNEQRQNKTHSRPTPNNEPLDDGQGMLCMRKWLHHQDSLTSQP
ncbi:hypothetical protein Hamer_G016763 [Homarus americanus]|uniref:Uncharacterized protein n=1 Tax=Homarus americanus TaxID=6706 RepID=A0A8J5K7T1_HOMAM|nr:hypothetical protein Hamer_G016763 [Homarus americanus]